MQYLDLGIIVNTHGLLGEVKVLCSYYGNSYPWASGTTIYLQNNDELITLVITKIRKHQQFLLLTFQDYNKIELVEKFKTKHLVVTPELVAEHNLPWLYEDIVGYQAFDANNNAYLGQVSAFFDNNHQGLWEVKMANDKTFFIPINKVFINKINKTEQKVYFNVIEGLIK